MADAQKLPNTQQESLRLPANVKIDGKATEWNNQFQAYNHATDVFYTVANDDDRLYLTIQVTDPLIINNIIGGGITFTIQKSAKKTDKDGIAITYPIFDKDNKPYMRMKSKRGVNAGQTLTPAQADSVMNINNKRLADNSKLIAVTGIKGLDTLISVYNQDGIKTAELFDNKMVYTYELAVDLKRLELTRLQKFAYHITVNGPGAAAFGTGVLVGNTLDRTANPQAAASLDALVAKVNTLSQPAAPTDFWGEYTLSKGN